MNGKKTTIKSKLEAIAMNKPKRLMGFKVWCELVWEPVQRRNKAMATQIKVSRRPHIAIQRKAFD